MKSLKHRQQQFEELRQRLLRIKAPRVRIRVYPCACRDRDSARGVCDFDVLTFGAAASGGGGEAPVEAAPAGSAQDGPRLEAIRVGDYLHVAARSEVEGYLHFFNLGVSGDVCKLFPESPASAARVAPGVSCFITENEGGSPFMEEAEAFLEDGDDERRANGYPERLLALVTPRLLGVAATDLHPDWEGPAGTRGGDPWEGFAIATGHPAGFWGQPEAWEWGWWEAPVVDA
ncbi:MAG: hypothetical protein JJT96_10920 [Opitutales bacterium]|nr:hypothetical protein [Opitutales bacterium]